MIHPIVHSLQFDLIREPGQQHCLTMEHSLYPHPAAMYSWSPFLTSGCSLNLIQQWSTVNSPSNNGTQPAALPNFSAQTATSPDHGPQPEALLYCEALPVALQPVTPPGQGAQPEARNDCRAQNAALPNHSVRLVVLPYQGAQSVSLSNHS